MDQAEFQQAIRAHDRLADARLPGIWVGAEPTFTLRSSQSPEWLSDALGGDKLEYAWRMMRALAARHNHPLVLRTVGRQYSGEDRPRWSLGLYLWRADRPSWQGPSDPLGADLEPAPSNAHGALRDALAGRLRRAGWWASDFDLGGALPTRLLARPDGKPTELAPDEPRLRRDPLHLQEIPRRGLADELAAGGDLLLSCGPDDEQPDCTCLELPAFEDVDAFTVFLQLLQAACADAGLQHLILRGFPPPVDQRVAWTTLTPDPAVIEVNQAPFADLRGFLAATRELHSVAAEVGLSARRFQYNGASVDSGGGGQVTLGGASAADSPFFRVPQLLPRLIVYLNNHPSLSYLFATEYVGGCSQSPRPDEGVRENFSELVTALGLFRGLVDPAPEAIWRWFAPFLTDPSGNSHRSELNIEKLWNPTLPGRGCLGLVEFRALRMSSDPEQAASVAALLRALVAMLATAPDLEPVHWGDELHDRFALPWYLRADLREVLDELDRRGTGLDEPLRRRLLDRGDAEPWRRRIANCELQIEKALEFWPLVGDTASQESGGSRLVDASTRRLQLLIRCEDDSPPLDGWRLEVEGRSLPLHRAESGRGPVRLVGVRYREFQPWVGLHPGVPAQNPLRIRLGHPGLAQCLEAELYNWQPEHKPYPDLPADATEARRRRDERLVTRIVDVGRGIPPPETDPGPCSIDLRSI